ncbi:SOS response-associated peptidase [Phormidesmis priestleyi ULC007]|uniref:Abasic site processing protein n=1 Tax=Phormidesmis priestleyi ULC007 TaxID=1920490 RepID=A0A2T1DCG7_9CYAN|nr:SOS response-associated peptidase [Phormidesmis priestleyi]PSB18143.1 SOS response-associated peptidase [Phormidesmis priestleyi ULC007]PZO49653.1 MAG: SOS response-associated peptidase [Phormidesmis priestleyi]
MCGRFSQSLIGDVIAEAFQLVEIPDWQPRYNIAPTQTIPAIVAAESGNRQFKPLRWGLIPSWSKDPAIGAKLINARSETVTEKPSFRSAFKQRRCLILADGFYEWRKQSGKKQPFYFRLEDSSPFAFAGLWERWHDSEDDRLETCTILTTEANQTVAQVHDRMPVILHADSYDRWLDPSQPLESLQALLCPYDSNLMTAYPVNSSVNSPWNDTPDCTVPLVEPMAT